MALNLAVLISGRGSNMEALIKAAQNDPDFPARVTLVLSDNHDAGGLAIARSHNIPAFCVNRRDFADKATFEAAMLEHLDANPVDLICLAGFMRLLSADFVNRYHDRIINIHPSLLPDYKGLDTHARALADGRTESGCTVHYVRAEMDSGPIILQRKVPILPDDTTQTLAARILAEEHQAYPDAIRKIAASRL